MKSNKIIIFLLIFLCIAVLFFGVNSFNNGLLKEKNEKKVLISIIHFDNSGKFEGSVNEILTFDSEGKCQNCKIVKTFEDKEIPKQIAIEIASDFLSKSTSNPVLQENSIAYEYNGFNGLEEHEIISEFESRYFKETNENQKFLYSYYEL